MPRVLLLYRSVFFNTTMNEAKEMFVIVVDETEYDYKELYESAMKTEEFPATNASRFTVLPK